LTNWWRGGIIKISALAPVPGPTIIAHLRPVVNRKFSQKMSQKFVKIAQFVQKQQKNAPFGAFFWLFWLSFLHKCDFKGIFANF
jgi:hypothetical protein